MKERNNGDNQLDGIAQCRIEQAAQCLSHPQCNLFRSVGEQGGKRHDCEEGREKNDERRARLCFVQCKVQRPGDGDEE